MDVTMLLIAIVSLVVAAGSFWILIAQERRHRRERPFPRFELETIGNCEIDGERWELLEIVNSGTGAATGVALTPAGFSILSSLRPDAASTMGLSIGRPPTTFAPGAQCLLAIQADDVGAAAALLLYSGGPGTPRHHQQLRIAWAPISSSGAAHDVLTEQYDRVEERWAQRRRPSRIWADYRPRELLARCRGKTTVLIRPVGPVEDGVSFQLMTGLNAEQRRTALGAGAERDPRVPAWTLGAEPGESTAT